MGNPLPDHLARLAESGAPGIAAVQGLARTARDRAVFEQGAHRLAALLGPERMSGMQPAMNEAMRRAAHCGMTPGNALLSVIDDVQSERWSPR
jgi:hypothetical protein